MLVALIIMSVLSLLGSIIVGVIISKKSDKERQYSSEMTKQEFAYGAGYWLATITTISLALLFGYLDSKCAQMLHIQMVLFITLFSLKYK